MNTKLLYSVAVFVALFCQTTFADTVNFGNAKVGFFADGDVFQFATPKGTEYVYAIPGVAQSNTDGYVAPPALFCGDLFDEWSGGYMSSGQNFFTQTTNYYDPNRSAKLQNLFNHTYSSIFNADGSFATTNAMAMQISIWEIVTESNASSLSLNSGNFQNISYGNAAAANLAESWLVSLNTNVWSDPFNSAKDFELTVFVPVNAQGAFDITASQIQIGVTGINESTTPSSTSSTPEPATLAIMGLGLLGAGFTARRKRAC